MAGLKAGLAEVHITPPIGISLCGFAGRKGPAESVIDDLFAQALVLDDGETRMAIVGADIISFAPDLVDRIRTLVDASTGISGSHLVLNGSHTHSGPTVMAFRCMGDRDAAYDDVLCRQVVSAVKMAADRLQPAILSHGRAPVRIAYNRREMRDGRIVLGLHPDGPEAPWVDVVRVDGEGGQMLGLVFATASHPVNLSGLAFSAEFPGYAAQFIRRNFNGVIPVFLQGCCGDINCWPKDKTVDGSIHLGTLLGAAAMTAALNATPMSSVRLDARVQTVGLPLMAPSVEEAEAALASAQSHLAQAQRDPDVTPYQVRQRFEGQVGWAEDYLAAARDGNRNPIQPFEVQAFRLGDLALVAYPGEMFVDYQLVWETESPFDRTIALGYSNGCIGYVPTADAYPLGGYEVEQAFKYYGTLMISPESERLIKEATLTLLRDLKS